MVWRDLWRPICKIFPWDTFEPGKPVDLKAVQMEFDDLEELNLT